MQLYQFTIFIITFTILLSLFGFRLLYILNEKLTNIKLENKIENFKGDTDDVIMPDIRKKKHYNKRQYPDVDIPLGEGLEDDYAEYLETDKIYINPFYPDEKKPIQKPTQNYANPQDMSSTERNAFKYGYPNNMTMQDYVNWLYLFRFSPDLLNLDHNINYQKLIKNTQIKYEKNKTPPPAKRIPPITSEDYFLNMYSQNPTQPDPMFTQTINQEPRIASNLGDPSNGILAYNYKDFPDFRQNFNVMGNTQNIYNNELADKTDPYFLQKYVGPVMLVREPKLSDK